MPLERKQIDDVLGGKDAWENVDQTEADCQNNLCDSKKAFFMQI